MTGARPTVVALALVALLPLLAVLAGQVEGLSLGTDRGEYEQGDRVSVVASGTGDPVTFQVVWGSTTLVVESMAPVNGSCALDFTLPADVLGTVQVYAASPSDNGTTSFLVVRRDAGGDGHDGFVLPEDPLFPVMVGTVVATITAIGGLWSVETTRWYLLGIPAVVAGARHRRDGSRQREKIQMLIQARYSTVRRGTRMPFILTTLGIATGTAAYHLRRLQKEKEIYSLSYNKMKFFFPKCAPFDESRRQLAIIEWYPTRTQLSIMNFLDRMPGSTKEQIKRGVGIALERVGHGILVLRDRGWIVEAGTDPVTYDLVRTPKEYRCSLCGYSMTSNIPPRVCALCERPFIDLAS